MMTKHFSKIDIAKLQKSELGVCKPGECTEMMFMGRIVPKNHHNELRKSLDGCPSQNACGPQLLRPLAVGRTVSAP